MTTIETDDDCPTDFASSVAIADADDGSDGDARRRNSSHLRIVLLDFEATTAAVRRMTHPADRAPSILADARPSQHR